MKLFGSISELVSAVFRKNSQAITLRPNQTTTYTAARDIQTPQQDANSILVSRDSTDTLTNKTFDPATTTASFRDTLFTIQDDGDPTKQAKFQASGITTATTRTFTFPDASTTLVGTDTTQTLQNKTLDVTNTLTIKSGTGFTLADPTDVTKRLQFDLSGFTTGNTWAATFPNESITVVGTSTTQTLTNKTLGSTNTITGAAATSFTNAGTVTLPSGTRTLVARDTTDTLSNKTLDNTNTITVKDTLFTLQDNGDTSKQVVFELSGLTTATTRTLTVPNASTTLVGTGVTQSLTNKSFDNSNTYVTKDTLWTLQDDGDATKQLNFQLSSITTGQTRVLTVPDANTTIVGDDATQVLTNKDINGGTASNTNRITLPKAITTTLNGLTRKQGTIVYDTTTNQVKYDDGSSLTALSAATSTFIDNVFTIQDDGDNTKQLRFQVSGVTTGTTRTLTVPDANDTIAVLGTAQSFTALQTFSSGVKYATSGGTAATLNYYESSTSSTTWSFVTSGGASTGGTTSSSTTYTYERIGNFVTIKFPIANMRATTGTSARFLISTTAIPTQIRPANTQGFYVTVFETATTTTFVGFMTILATGIVRVYKTDAGNTNWTNSVTAGVTDELINDFVVSYLVI